MSTFNKLITSMEDTKEIDQAIEVMEAEDSSDPEDIEKVEDYKEELEKLKQQEQQEEGTDSIEEEGTDTAEEGTETTGEDEATGEETGEESPEATEGGEESTEESSKEPKETEGEENGEVQENQKVNEEGKREEEMSSETIQEPVVTEPVIEPEVTETPEATIVEPEKEIEVDYEVMIKEGEENLEPIDGLKEKLEEAKECGSMESITAFDLRKARKAIETLGFSIEGLNMIALSTESENHAENLDAAIVNLKKISTKVQHGIKMAKNKLAASEQK